MRLFTAIVLVLAVVVGGNPSPAVEDPPAEWVDRATGHRVVRLSREPGSASLYFHQNAYTAAGDKMVFTTPAGISAIELKTRRIEPIVDGRASHIVVAPKSRQVFYMRDGTIYATHLDTRVTRAIVARPELRSGSGLTVNADETMLAGSYVEGGAADTLRPPSSTGASSAGGGSSAASAPPVPRRRINLEQRWAARLPMALYTVSVESGAVHAFYRSTDWLNHVQFSPADPTLLMFCHEGPWHKVDRIWTVRTDGRARRKMHARTMEMEIAGHEFFGRDGRTIWYDLQTPRSKVFWLAGVEVNSGRQTRSRLAREHWSVHYNVSHDGRLFAGDGGGPRSVAAPGNGQWIYLFRPKEGALEAERLVDLSRHDYDLEPNVTFTPDGRWVVFRSNMHGAPHVYAVEVARTGAAR